MTRVLVTLLLLWPWAAATGAAQALPGRAEGALDDGDPRAVVELVADAERVRPGDTFRAGVRFDLDPCWHRYWHNPGGGAMATAVELSGGGVRLGEPRWPAPSRFEQAGFIVTYGYAEQVTLPFDATVSSGASGEVTVEAVADFLVCEVECIPDRLTVRRTIPVGPERVPDDDAGELLDRWASRVPVVAGGAGVDVDVALQPPTVRPGERFTATVAIACAQGAERCGGLGPPEGGAEHAFFPDRIAGVDVSPKKVTDHPEGGDGVAIVLEGEAAPDAPDAPRHLSGVAVLGRDDAEPLRLRIRGPPLDGELGAQAAAAQRAKEPAEAAAAKTKTTSTPGLPLWQTVLFALLGGLLLNLMPCVLPVLAIKAFGLVRIADEGERPRAMHAAAYAGGILATFAVLAGLVVALRAGGTELGWGFQLQEPLFVAVLGAVLLVFALALFGVLRLSVRTDGLAARVDASQGLARSAGEGVLAVVVATPCTAPFLGSAVGFALAGDAALVFGVFLAVGVGLAAPFVLLVLVPGARRLLPRPGPWMHKLEVLLGFALLGTVVWLVWLLGRVTGTDGVVRMLAFLLAVALATWIAGTWAFALEARRWTRALAGVLAVGLAAGAGAVSLRFDESAAAADARAQGRWAQWSPEAVDAALAEGDVVFVDFTADWCITCKVNEATVLEDGAVAEKLFGDGVTALQADWTRRDETIRKELARHGRAGVPLYLVISPAAPDEPRVLPEVLTEAIVLDALRRAAGRDGTTKKPDEPA